jgi:hypothetical protein
MSGLAAFVARQAKTAALQRNPGLRQRAADALKQRTQAVTAYTDWTADKASNTATYRGYKFLGDDSTIHPIPAHLRQTENPNE